MLDETAFVISSSDGVGIIIKKNPAPEKFPRFEFDDPLCTKVIQSKIQEPTYAKKCVVKSIGNSSAIVVSGIEDERKKVLGIATQGIKEFHQLFNKEAPVKDLADFIGSRLNNITHTSTQPLPGVEVILTAWNIQTGPEVYIIKPNGDHFRYNACAIGGHNNHLNHKLSQTNLSNLTINQCLVEALKLLMEKDNSGFEFEVMRICGETEGIYQMASTEFCNQICDAVSRK